MKEGNINRFIFWQMSKLYQRYYEMTKTTGDENDRTDLDNRIRHVLCSFCKNVEADYTASSIFNTTCNRIIFKLKECCIFIYIVLIHTLSMILEHIISSWFSFSQLKFSVDFFFCSNDSHNMQIIGKNLNNPHLPFNFQGDNIKTRIIVWIIIRELLFNYTLSNPM